MPHKILIYGSKDFGAVLRDMLLQMELPFAGYIDDYNTGEEIVGTYDYVIKNLSRYEHEIVIGIGYTHLGARWKIYQKIVSDGYSVPKLIHPNAYVRNQKYIGQGSIVMAGSIIDSNAKLGELVVVWPGVIVNHDSIVGNNTFLSPGAVVCGFATIEGNSFIGAGAVIADHVTVPPESFVKAGSVYSGGKKDIC